MIRRRIPAGSAAPPQAKGSDGGTRWLSLSLFLIILAIFIMLNAISDYDDRQVTAIVHSLEQVFGPLGEQSDNATDPVTTLGGARFFSDIQDVIGAEVQVAELEVVEDGDKMLVRLPLAEFTQELEAGSRRGSQLFRRLAIAMRRAPAGGIYHMTFLQAPQGSRVPDADTRRRRLQVRRAAEAAALMRRSGLPPESIYVGFGDVRRGWVELVFTVTTRSARARRFLGAVERARGEP